MAEERRLRGTDFSGRPVYAPTREEMARPGPITEEFDEQEALPDGRLIAQTGYDPATGTESFHEIDADGAILWDKPITREDVDRALEEGA